VIISPFFLCCRAPVILPDTFFSLSSLFLHLFLQSSVVTCEVHSTYICSISSDSALNPILTVCLLTAVGFPIFFSFLWPLLL
jgi:hypothetical protein